MSISGLLETESALTISAMSQHGAMRVNHYSTRQDVAVIQYAWTGLIFSFN